MVNHALMSVNESNHVNDGTHELDDSGQGVTSSGDRDVLDPLTTLGDDARSEEHQPSWA
ncbi:MAG: hypothetical protein K0V04_17545 [Deltaproteobacteria bacterium]|nr:hypothetical protein [Deltaproteobacteria bacterium]